MKLRTRLGYISAVCSGYLLLAPSDYAMRFTDSAAVREFLRDYAELLPFGIECVQ